MALGNCRVHYCTSHKMVLSWLIMTVEDGVMVQQFYVEKVACKLPKQEKVRLHYAGLGKSKDSLDTIEMSLSLEFVVQLFRSFLRYYIHSEQRQAVPMCDDFALLIAGQKRLSPAGLPAIYMYLFTRKDKLHNDRLCGFSARKSFVKTIVGCICYMDGHHEKLMKELAPRSKQ